MPRPEVTAVGLRWCPRTEGPDAAYWVAPPSAVKAGYEPKTQRIDYDIADPNAADLIRDRCYLYQVDVAEWQSGRPVVDTYDGSLASLIKLYESHPNSPYRVLRPNTQHGYSKHMRLLLARVGNHLIDDISGDDVRGWYMAMSAETSVSYAYLTISILKAVLSYGGSKGKGFEPCLVLRAQLTAAKFQNGERRTERMTYAQVGAFCAAAHAAGRPSMALGVTLQFECALRQRDVIGGWKVDDGATAGIRNGRTVWHDGLTWAHLSATGVLSKLTSKTGGLAEHRIADHPDLVAEMDLIPAERRVGPMVIHERTGLPYTAEQYRRTFRDIAHTAGIPGTVWNMDARAGAVTEAYEAGGDAIGVMSMATHTQMATSRRYNRSSEERVSTVAKQRVASRKNGG